MKLMPSGILLAFLWGGGVAQGQPFPVDTDKGTSRDQPGLRTDNADELAHPLHQLNRALIALPLATVLGAALAFRPKRRGTPPRMPAVIQTQIILSIVGAVVMLVVGASVARAFAVVGAAGLVRYRAKIEDPKDAGIMLCALAIGLGTGVGLYALASFSTAFIMLVVWIIESLEPPRQKSFELHVKTKDTAAVRGPLENLLHKHRIRYELRTSSQEELSYFVELPLQRRTDRISTAIQQLDPSGGTSVEWEEKKKGK